VSSYKLSGIIIKRSNFGEADRLITIFSSTYGKCQLLAKGARRPSARLAASVNLFDEVECVVAKTRSIDIIEEANIIRHRGIFETDLVAVKHAYQMAELIDQMLRSHDPYPSVYQLFQALLNQMETDSREWWVDYFYMQTLMASGFTPELSKCIICGRPLSDGDKLIFDANLGGVAMHSCVEKNIGEPIEPRIVKWLRLLTGDIDKVEKIAVDREIEHVGHRLISSFTSGILQREIKSDKI